MAESTWETVALPILEHIAAVEDDEAHHGIVTTEELADVLDEPPKRVENELRRLHARGYLLGKLEGSFGGPDSLVTPQLSELGARAIGKWPPDDPYELLLRLVEQRISNAETSEEQSRWRRMRDALVDIGKSGAGGLVVELTKAATGLNT